MSAPFIPHKSPANDFQRAQNKVAALLYPNSKFPAYENGGWFFHPPIKSGIEELDGRANDGHGPSWHLLDWGHRLAGVRMGNTPTHEQLRSDAVNMLYLLRGGVYQGFHGGRAGNPKPLFHKPKPEVCEPICAAIEELLTTLDP